MGDLTGTWPVQEPAYKHSQRRGTAASAKKRSRDEPFDLWGWQVDAWDPEPNAQRIPGDFWWHDISAEEFIRLLKATEAASPDGTARKLFNEPPSAWGRHGPAGGGNDDDEPEPDFPTKGKLTRWTATPSQD